jgi:hypothetical protein
VQVVDGMGNITTVTGEGLNTVCAGLGLTGACGLFEGGGLLAARVPGLSANGM